MWESVIATTIIIMILMLGFCMGYWAGRMIGWSRGHESARSFFGSFRTEDNETMNRLRGKIIWLEASIKEAKDLIRESELSAVMAKERLEKTEEST